MKSRAPKGSAVAQEGTRSARPPRRQTKATAHRESAIPVPPDAPFGNLSPVLGAWVSWNTALRGGSDSLCWAALSSLTTECG